MLSALQICPQTLTEAQHWFGERELNGRCHLDPGLLVSASPPSAYKGNCGFAHQDVQVPLFKTQNAAGPGDSTP
jgi:hypothetical protein